MLILDQHINLINVLY